MDHAVYLSKPLDHCRHVEVGSIMIRKEAHDICWPGSTRSGSSAGAAEAGLAVSAEGVGVGVGVGGVESARSGCAADGGDAGDASADHARLPRPNASDKHPGYSRKIHSKFNNLNTVCAKVHTTVIKTSSRHSYHYNYNILNRTYWHSTYRVYVHTEWDWCNMLSHGTFAQLLLAIHQWCVNNIIFTLSVNLSPGLLYIAECFISVSFKAQKINCKACPM